MTVATALLLIGSAVAYVAGADALCIIFLGFAIVTHVFNRDVWR